MMLTAANFKRQGTVSVEIVMKYCI